MSQALVFPGQGSQALGMGKALAENFPVAKQVFAEVDDALSQKLSSIMWDGTDEALGATENTQPAIMAVSVAAYRVMQREMGLDVAQAICVAGHSLGEYSALCAAGSLSLRDCATLLRIRGSAMQAAVPKGLGAMAAIIGPEMALVREIVAEASKGGEVVEIANHNSQVQVVISGSAKGVEQAMAIAKEKGAKRALLLNVSAPFHCSLMTPAAERMQEALAEAAIMAPKAPLIANVTAEPTSDPEAIRRQLVQQVTGMVRWVESVERMAVMNVTRALELGQGNVLAGLIKRIAPDIAVVSVGSPADIESYSKAA